MLYVFIYVESYLTEHLCMPLNKHTNCPHDKSYFSRNYPLAVFCLFAPENINAANRTYPASLCYIWEFPQPFMNRIAVGVVCTVMFAKMNIILSFVYVQFRKQVNSLPILIKIVDTDFTDLHRRYCPD